MNEVCCTQEEMAVLLYPLILFILTCSSLGLNETTSVERRDRSLYAHQPFYYPEYFGTHLVSPDYYGTPGYFRAPVEHQLPLGILHITMKMHKIKLYLMVSQVISRHILMRSLLEDFSSTNFSENPVKTTIALQIYHFVLTDFIS